MEPSFCRIADAWMKKGGQPIQFDRVAPGTTLWQVPIRFWETTTPQELQFLQEESRGDWGVYCYHPKWKHNAYFNRHDLFLTRPEAIREAKERAAEKERKFQEEEDAWWAANEERILEDMRGDR